MSTATLSDIDVARIADAVATRLTGFRKDGGVIDLEGVRVKLKCETRNGAWKALNALGVKPYTRGKYREADIDNAIARASQNARRAAS